MTGDRYPLPGVSAQRARRLAEHPGVPRAATTRETAADAREGTVVVETGSGTPTPVDWAPASAWQPRVDTGASSL